MAVDPQVSRAAVVSGMTRYKLIPPFPHGGEAWWLIADTESKHEPNFAVVQIFEWLPNAKDIATKICAALNAGQSI
jgi:hypothetical protein